MSFQIWEVITLYNIKDFKVFVVLLDCLSTGLYYFIFNNESEENPETFVSLLHFSCFVLYDVMVCL